MVDLGSFKDTKKTFAQICEWKTTGATVLCSAAEIACKGRQDFSLLHDGGHLIPIQSKIGQGMRIHFRKLVNWHGKNELTPIFSKTTFSIST